MYRNKALCLFDETGQLLSYTLHAQSVLEVTDIFLSDRPKNYNSSMVASIRIPSTYIKLWHRVNTRTYSRIYILYIYRILQHYAAEVVGLHGFPTSSEPSSTPLTTTSSSTTFPPPLAALGRRVRSHAGFMLRRKLHHFHHMGVLLRRCLLQFGAPRSPGHGVHAVVSTARHNSHKAVCKPFI